MAIFGYSRVSTGQQTTENQKMEIEQSGFKIDYWFSDDGVSGKVPAGKRPQFAKLLDKIRDGETLVVSKLDRLGRDALDVLQTTRLLAERQIRVVVLQLGGTDIISPAGKMLMSMLAAVAEMERDLMVERTHAGLARARKEGKQIGRPSKTTPEQRIEIIEALGRGESVSSQARRYNISRANVIGIREAALNYVNTGS